ncbi:hypothetical protein XENOCAPTIV_024840 [Xenoophorus captivus]|uniref:Uncharacterized protein n=1 Tax=Xenoophorus captivus TaxID=1517983 RepID=A0ABV0QCC1_9TELE
MFDCLDLELFSSIMEYCNRFKGIVEQWLNEPDELLQNENPQEPTFVVADEINYEFQVPKLAVSSEKMEVLQSNINPSESVSNVESRASASHKSASGGKSSASSTTYVRLKAEADLAALMVRQKLLKERHQ